MAQGFVVDASAAGNKQLQMGQPINNVPNNYHNYVPQYFDANGIPIRGTPNGLL